MEKIRELDGANMDIDLTTNSKDISWKQDKCPWNVAENTNKHKCAVKNISICPYFRGIKPKDFVLCAYEMKKVVVRESKHGKGVFANKNFRKDEIILRIDGEVVETENPQSFPDDIQNHWFPFDKIGKINKYILPQSPWMYINHSCQPNIGFKSNRDVVAMRKIKKGEEIFFDYSMNNIDNWTMKCNCGSKNCRGIISTVDKLNEKTREKYKDYILDCLK